jgi:predicted RNase H-like HicB family nuclease
VGKQKDACPPYVLIIKLACVGRVTLSLTRPTVFEGVNFRLCFFTSNNMKLKVIIHIAEEGGFWAEVPAIQGCATQGETIKALLGNIYEAVEACLSIDLPA